MADDLLKDFLPDLDVIKARRIQERLRKKIRLEPFLTRPEMVAGVDVSYRKGRPDCSACVVVLKYPSLEILEVSTARASVDFPCIPGLLSFREIPPVIAAWRKLKSSPDLLMVDGHGTAHPRGFGLACHLGVLLDLPSVGCAKKHFFGDYVEPASRRGDFSYVTHPDKGNKIGAVLRTRSGVKPVFVSPGHRMDLAGSVKVTFSLVFRYRLPTPLRLAHTYAGKGWD